MNFLKKVSRLAKLIFTPLAAAFIAYYVWLSRDELSELLLTSEPGWLVSSILLLTLLHLCSPWFTVLTFRNLGCHVAYRPIAAIHIRYLPAKYMPGGIWHSVARVTEYIKLGLSSRDISIYFISESVVLVGVTLGVGGLFSALVFSDSQWRDLFWFIGIAVLGTTLIYPFVINLFFSEAYKKLQVTAYVFSFLVFLLYWTGVASAFVCFFLAFPHVSSDFSPYIAGIAYVVSWGVGYIAIFAPHGIGVTEFVSAKLLDNDGQFAFLIVLFAGFRIAMLMADVIAWALLMIKTSTKKDRS